MSIGLYFFKFYDFCIFFISSVIGFSFPILLFSFFLVFFRVFSKVTVTVPVRSDPNGVATYFPQMSFQFS